MGFQGLLKCTFGQSHSVTRQSTRCSAARILHGEDSPLQRIFSLADVRGFAEHCRLRLLCAAYVRCESIEPEQLILERVRIFSERKTSGKKKKKKKKKKGGKKKKKKKKKKS